MPSVLQAASSSDVPGPAPRRPSKMSGRLSPAKMLGAWLHANGSDGELSLHDDAEPASVEEENASLKRRVAALEATLRRVRGERADLERVRRVMKRNSRLRRKLGLALVASYVLYYCCWNLSFLAGYNKLRGRPRDCAVTRYGGLILEGGGVKGVAYGGAAAALEAYGLLDRRHVTHFAGTSAGAMMGALLAARTPAEDIARYLLDFPFERLMDGGHALANAGRLQRRLGWFRGDEVERAMRELLDKAGVGGNATLGELEKARKTTLRLSVTDLTRGRHAWLDATNMNNVSVARAGARITFAVPLAGRAAACRSPLESARAAGCAPDPPADFRAGARRAGLVGRALRLPAGAAREAALRGRRPRAEPGVGRVRPLGRRAEEQPEAAVGPAAAARGPRAVDPGARPRVGRRFFPPGGRRRGGRRRARAAAAGVLSLLRRSRRGAGDPEAARPQPAGLRRAPGGAKGKLHGAFVPSHRPPRHRRGVCSTAWRRGALAARLSRRSRVVAEKRVCEIIIVRPTHRSICAQALGLWHEAAGTRRVRRGLAERAPAGRRQSGRGEDRYIRCPGGGVRPGVARTGAPRRVRLPVRRAAPRGLRPRAVARAAAVAGRVTAERIAGLIRAHGEGRSFVAAEARHPAAGGGQANGLSGALSNTTGSN